jgi:hypothetical protein
MLTDRSVIAVRKLTRTEARARGNAAMPEPGLSDAAKSECLDDRLRGDVFLHDGQSGRFQFLLAICASTARGENTWVRSSSAAR